MNWVALRRSLPIIFVFWLLSFVFRRLIGDYSPIEHDNIYVSASGLLLGIIIIMIVQIARLCFGSNKKSYPDFLQPALGFAIFSYIVGVIAIIKEPTVLSQSQLLLSAISAVVVIFSWTPGSYDEKTTEKTEKQVGIQSAFIATLFIVVAIMALSDKFDTVFTQSCILAIAFIIVVCNLSEVVAMLIFQNKLGKQVGSLALASVVVCLSLLFIDGVALSHIILILVLVFIRFCLKIISENEFNKD